MRFKPRRIGRHELAQAPNNGAFLSGEVFTESPPDILHRVFLTPEEVLILLGELEALKPEAQQAIVDEAIRIAKKKQ